MGYGFGNRIAVGRRAITAQAQAEQVIWKVAVYGAGTTSSNGEYVWDGTTLENGKPIYFAGSNYIQYSEFEDWILFDDGLGDITYNSAELSGTWTELNGDSPAPSSALSYAQDSEIQSITLSGAGTTSSNGEYVWDGETFSLDKPLYISGLNSISWTGSYWGLIDDTTLGGDEAYSSSDLISWSESNGDLPAPSVSAVVYSA